MSNFNSNLTYNLYVPKQMHGRKRFKVKTENNTTSISVLGVLIVVLCCHFKAVQILV